MKLITKSSLTFISASVLFFLLGSIIMYFSVRTIFSSNLNDTLLEKKTNLVKQIEPDNVERFYSNDVFVNKINSDIPSSFSDTVLIESGKYILYRKIDFSYFTSDQYYKISVLEPQKKTDILVSKIVIMNVGLAFIFFLILFFVNRHSVNNTLKIFYRTISKLEQFNLNNNDELHLDSAQLFEIKKMNSVIQKMADTIRKDFELQKEYTENVSHELQTPLAVINSKVDELMQSDNLTKPQMEQLAILMETTNRLSKINQALIFLTKIDNRFYTKGSTFSVNQLLKEQLDLFEESIQQKNIKVTLNLLDTTHIYMDKYLAETMINNLVRNAISHNNDIREINISIENNCFIISNSGDELTFPSDKILDRFSKSTTNKKSLGIGLSVVKSICDLYHFELSYSQDNFHTFIIKFK
ncbi:MAG: HAMP domain-containing sensor histidine kinase [Flavobacteriales bacterium]